MRDFAIFLGILLLAAVLVYGGLNLTELGLSGLLARECRHESFSIGTAPGGALLITFAGRATRLHAGELRDAFGQWWDGLLRRSREIFIEVKSLTKPRPDDIFIVKLALDVLEC